VCVSSATSGSQIGGAVDLLRILFSSESSSIDGPAIFIDRDGVINRRRPGDYVLDRSQFVFLPGIRSALKQLSSLGLPLIVISNQAAVGKGLLDPSGLEEITTYMYQTLLSDEVFLFAAYYCIHRSNEDCICRKPKPGLLLRAAKDFNIDLSRSIFIGDSDTDLQAAQAAGCTPVLFGPELSASSRPPGWAMRVPVARTPEEIFDVAVQCLHLRQQPESGAPVVHDPSAEG
jgi:D-glycero-D-manno-heptose 1,7-bisphosphate phosphatase